MRAKGLLRGYFCLFFTLGKENGGGGRGRGPSSRRLSFLCCRRSWRLPHIHMARSAPPECAAPLGTALPPTVSDPGPHSVHLDLMQRMEDAWFSMSDVICIPVYSQFCGASLSQPCKWGNEGQLEVAQMESAKSGPRAEAKPLPPDLLGRSVPPSSENCGQRSAKSPHIPSTPGRWPPGEPWHKLQWDGYPFSLARLILTGFGCLLTAPG